MKRRIPHYRNGKAKKKDILLFIKFLFYLLLFVSAFFVFIKLVVTAIGINRKYRSEKPVIMAINFKNQIGILKYDPKYEEVVLLAIDGETIFDTAGGLGEYPARSLFELGLNEKKGSELLRLTLMKNLHIPVYETVDCRNRSVSGSVSATDILRCSNAKADQLLYVGYALWKGRGNIVSKDLVDYRVLETDETDGKRIGDGVFSRLEFDFSADLDNEDVISVEIETPEMAYVPQYFDDVIKISGGRVVKTSDLKVGEVLSGCRVVSGSRGYLNYIGVIFGCGKDLVSDTKKAVIKFSPEYIEAFY